MKYTMVSFQNEVRKMIDEKKPITLMHLWVMIFENLEHSRYASNDQPQPFLKEVLCTAIKRQISDKGQISDAEFLSTEYENRKVYPIMRKGYNESYAKSEIYDRIYNILIQSTDDVPFLYLNEQYDTLRHLAVNPNAYADKLWNAMRTTWDRYDHKSYFDILCERARWLLKDHEEDWKKFDADRIYKLFTVAIAISLNQKTWTTTDDEDLKEPTDPLDILCKKFLYDGPPEVLPDFTLRNVFNTLFSDDPVFAVKRTRDDEYVMEKRDKLTDRDKLCILLPWLGIECDLHPEPEEEEAAAALMDNKIAEPEIADRVLKFFVYFSKHKDDVWNKFVAHLKESLTLCTLVERKKKKPKASVDNILKQKQPLGSLPDLSERYLDILDSESEWSRINRDRFWDGDLVDISLPEQCKSEKDVEQLYQYIAAYVLIALCCLKIEGSETREVRQAFKEALIHKIHAPMSVPIEVHEKVKQENEALAQELERQRNTNASTLLALAALLSAFLDSLQINSPMERQAYAEAYCREEMSLNAMQISRILNLLKAKDESKRLVRSTHGWDNGGN